MSQKKTFSTRINVDCLKALKHLAVDEDKSIGVLLEEAIEDLIRKYKKKKKRGWNLRQGYFGSLCNKSTKHLQEPKQFRSMGDAAFRTNTLDGKTIAVISAILKNTALFFL